MAERIVTIKAEVKVESVFCGATCGYLERPNAELVGCRLFSVELATNKDEFVRCAQCMVEVDKVDRRLE